MQPYEDSDVESGLLRAVGDTLFYAIYYLFLCISVYAIHKADYITVSDLLWRKYDVL